MKSDSEILSLLNSEIRASSGYIGGEIVTRRKKSLEYYLGKPFGNEQEGRSQVISTDVSDTVESLMPSLMKIFTAGDNVFHCEPVGPEDERVAKQATDYINHTFYKENRGFTALYTAFKDALIQKNGILKIYWDDSEKTTREEYHKLTDDEYNILIADDEVSVGKHKEYKEDLKDSANQSIDKITYHDVVIYKTESYGQVKIEGVPPEEFLIERRAKSIDTANFVCHRTLMSRTQLVEMGYDKDVVDKLSTGDSEYYLEDRQVRHQGVDFSSPQDKGDESSEEVLVHECYIRMDANEDGKSELYKVCLGGIGAYKILGMDEVDSIPFVSMTPIIMPHRFYGRSVSELIEDIQLIKSTVMRQMLDNMYLTNNNRIAIQDGQVAIDDLLTNRPGGIVRTKQPPANVMQVMTAQPITEQASGLLGYLDSVIESRSGVTKASQGLSSDSLNTDTATGMNQVLTQSQMRMELIARTFAETGIKDLGIKIFELLCKYQQKEKLLRIRGEFVPMTPYEWRDRVNLSVKVGLGTGSKEQQLILLNSILQKQLQAIQLQGNHHGPVVNLKNIYSTLEKLVENAGLGSAEPFFMDPVVGAASMPPIPPPPPTEFEKVSLAQVQGENERAVLNAQVSMKKSEAEMRQKLLEFELAIKEMELKYGTKINELELKNKSMVQSTQVKQSGEIFKEIMKGQQKFFNDKGSNKTNFGGEQSKATAGGTPDEGSI
tara:strand:- start:2955 stop:5108 length:2154 start_codon:yes stop_codon:yes gene_type:complete